MLAIVLVGLIAAAAAAPHVPYGPPPYRPQPPYRPGLGHYDPFGEELFDTRQFWAEMANEMRELDTLLAEFYKKFPSVISTQGVEGGQYKITIPLSGFEEKDIVVKAREGLLMVQAVHKLENGGESSYLDIKTLPACVNVTGTWTFENGVLRIVFPLKPEAETEEPVTRGHSREELASREDDANADTNAKSDDNADVDVGVRESQENDRELITNEIPKNSVEATTYAVDLKGDVEFVPVKY